MTDKQREFQAVREGLNSPFWRWVREHLKQNSAEYASIGVGMLPDSPAAMVEREQIFGKAKALTELVDQIPNTINEQFKRLGEESK